MRPDPVITEHATVATYADKSTLTLDLLGEKVPLADGTKAHHIWVNVENKGKSAIRGMRLKAKFAMIPNLEAVWEEHEKIEATSIPEMMEKFIVLHPELREYLDLSDESIRHLTPLIPTSRTPQGTLSIPWIRSNGESVPQIDLSPNDDDASALVLDVYRLTGRAKELLVTKGLAPKSSKTDVLALRLGSTSFVFPDWDMNGDVFVDVILMVWLVAENLTSFDPRIISVSLSTKDTGTVGVKGLYWWEEDYQTYKAAFEMKRK